MKYLKVVFSILVLFICIGSSCDDTTSPVDDATITENIGTSGGIVEHPDGMQIDFEEGTFNSKIKVCLTALTDQEVTNIIPSEIEKISNAFSIDVGGIKPNKPVKIFFSFLKGDHQRKDGAICIFCYDGDKTTFAGATTVDSGIYCYTKDFSIFYYGTYFGDKYLLK